MLGWADATFVKGGKIQSWQELVVIHQQSWEAWKDCYMYKKCLYSDGFMTIYERTFFVAYMTCSEVGHQFFFACLNNCITLLNVMITSWCVYKSMLWNFGCMKRTMDDLERKINQSIIQVITQLLDKIIYQSIKQSSMHGDYLLTGVGKIKNWGEVQKRG